MLVNITLGFALPWITAIYLIKKDLPVFLAVFPFVSMCAFVFDFLFFHAGWYIVEPYMPPHEMLPAFPFKIGIYPITGVLLIHTITSSKKKGHWYWLFLFAIVITALEGIAVHFERIHYGNNWNLFWTFAAYLFFMWLTFFYYEKLKKLMKS
ncbi:CBO0543 family protein [Bacillus marinisedimentorum]|uniref:CBO0543 family protein n=1 Tax=Bacillus marinisedimentorum TaxID=1821260 RepID=UPI000872F748|nr:CBO0543 family protein [Bacillus marinisedimentorum]